MSGDSVRKLVFAALFTALICVATIVIQIPTIGVNGYLNIGDAFVDLSGWMLGWLYGGAAAGVGSALADLFTGYAFYAPATFIIKFAMAAAGFFVFHAFSKRDHRIIGLIISGIVSELIMTFGYVFYEAFILGIGRAAVVAVPGYLIKGVANIVIAFSVYLILDKSGVIRRFFIRS